MNIDLKFYWKLFWRRLPVMTLFVLVCSTLGVISAMKLPETWSTSARLLVEAPQIPDEMVTSTVRITAREQLQIIQERLLTRANLIDIANRFNVFENQQQMQPDEVVSSMRAATRILRRTGREQATLMTISFEARSGKIAADVVNEYVTLVLAANADYRQDRAEGTLRFFEQEVERLSQDLDAQSARIAAFKSTNVDSLPEDQSYRLNRQALLQERAARLERELSAGRAQREQVLSIFERTGRTRTGPELQPRRTREENQLLVAEGELDQALSVYSELHPRVIRLKDRITRLEAVVAAQTESRAEQAQGEDSTISESDAMLQATLAEIDSRMEFMQDDLATVQAELEDLQTRISLSSATGIELASLQRDYSNIQSRYTAAVNNLNSARMSERIETTAQGQRISVIENANIPRVPTGPNRPRIAIAGAAVGLALAGAYFLLLELINRKVRRPVELVSRFNVVPLATIPYMESRSRRFYRRGAILSATLLVLIFVPLGLWYIDTNFIPLEIAVKRGLERLGLG